MRALGLTDTENSAPGDSQCLGRVTAWPAMAVHEQAEEGLRRWFGTGLPTEPSRIPRWSRSHGAS